MEKLTRELIDSHLMSFIETSSAVQRDGVTRWAWSLSSVAAHRRGQQEVEGREWSYEFRSFETARDFALGWIRTEMKDLVRAATDAAKEGIRYRSTRRPN